jgi:hypothetical protein
MVGLPGCDGVTSGPAAGGDALYPDEAEQAASDATPAAMIKKRFIGARGAHARGEREQGQGRQGRAAFIAFAPAAPKRWCRPLPGSTSEVWRLRRLSEASLGKVVHALTADVW